MITSSCDQKLIELSVISNTVFVGDLRKIMLSLSGLDDFLSS